MPVSANRAKICPLRTDTSEREPATAEILTGEIFINMADDSLGYKHSDGTIHYIVGREGSDTNNVVHLTGAETITGQKTFTQTIIGTCQRALWADLAEYYEADKEYTPGTLLQFGGKYELTAAKTTANFVVSTQPGFVLNNAKNFRKGCHPVLVAVSGRVPVKVFDRVEKGDKIVADPVLAGCGRVDNNASEDQVIAVALRSNHQTGYKTVLCATRMKLV